MTRTPRKMGPRLLTGLGPSVPGLPAGKCFVCTDTNSVFDRYICVAPAQCWGIMASSKQDFDATHQVTAQYLMLAGK